MANKRVRSIGDLIRWELDLSVACRRCRRTAWFDAREVQAHLLGKGLIAQDFPPPLTFTCRCGSKDMSFGFGPVDMRPAPLPVRKVGLVPIYVRAGAG